MSEDPSSPNNFMNTSNLNKSFKNATQNQKNGNNSTSRGGSNGSNPRHIGGNHHRQTSAN